MSNILEWDSVTEENEDAIADAVRDANAGNYDRAEKVLREFSDRGSIFASLRLAEIMEMQDGKYENDEIEKYFALSSASGNAYVKFLAGKFYLRIGEDDKAFDLIASSCTSGYLPSCYLISILFRDGIGCEKSNNNFRYYTEYAASYGHLWAKRRLYIEMIKGKHGLLQRFKGFFGFLSLPLKVARVAYKDPESELLLG